MEAVEKAIAVLGSNIDDEHNGDEFRKDSWTRRPGWLELNPPPPPRGLERGDEDDQRGVSRAEGRAVRWDPATKGRVGHRTVELCRRPHGAGCRPFACEAGDHAVAGGHMHS